MSWINPIASTPAQSTAPVRVRRATTNAEHPTEPEVETADAVILHEDQDHPEQQNQKRRKQSHTESQDDAPPEHLDITA